MRLFRELSARLPDDAIVAADSGSAANWYARQLRFRGGMRGSLSGTLATMGPGVPYAIGAKFAHPDRPAIAFEGDGAMQMNGLAELITDQALLAGVGRPAAGRRGAAQQRPQPGHLGDAGDGRRAASSWSPRTCPTSPTPPSPPASGWRAITVDRPGELGAAWDEALAADRPTCSTCTATPTCRRSRRTPPSSRCATRRWRWPRATPTGGACIKEGIKTKAQELLSHTGR